MHNYTKSFKKGKYEVIDCLSCGFAHIYPIPSEQEINEFYKAQYFEQVKKEYLTGQSNVDQVHNEIRFKERFETFANLKNVKTNGRILDIGCGNGMLLKYFKENGWETVGIEPSQIASEFAKGNGINVINGPLSEVDYKDLGLFDAINLTCVLEHIPNPLEVCRIVFDLLKPGALACFEVPNDFNELQKVICDHFDKEMWWISVPDHINYFNFDTLQALLNKVGFAIELKTTSFPMELLVLLGDDYIGNKEVGKVAHQKRTEFERVLINTGRNQVIQDIYRALADIGLGRSAIIYARKPEK